MHPANTNHMIFLIGGTGELNDELLKASFTYVIAVSHFQILFGPDLGCLESLFLFSNSRRFSS